MKQFNPLEQVKTKYLFYTGKGGVGKTSVACSTAVTLADNGKKVLLISTDPASNLQDVFETQLNGKGVKIKAVPNLVVANLDPIQSAAEYRESVIAPYRGKLPDAVLKNMEEQLSGSCTVEIAAFNEFSNFITDDTVAKDYDHIILEKYKETVLKKARENNMNEDDIAYIEEDLRSPCTQEIAVFRAFADIVERAEKEVVVIDTAPTGHTLLLLDSTQSYHKEVQRTMGDTPESVKNLLPQLRNANETEVVIVTLAETTPVFEAMRLEEDLHRAGIHSKWWVINSSLYATDTKNQMLKAKASNEIEWINKVASHANGNFAVIKWNSEEIKGDRLLEL